MSCGNSEPLDYDREGRNLVIQLDWKRRSRFPVAEEEDEWCGGHYRCTTVTSGAGATSASSSAVVSW